MALLAAGIGALGVSCGGNLCDRVDGVIASLNSKAQACATVAPVVTQAMFTRTACLAGLPRCSETDQRALNAQIDCLLKVPACTAGQEAQFLGALEPCKFTVAAVSAACSNALQSH